MPSRPTGSILQRKHPGKLNIFNDDLNTNYISVAYGGLHEYPIISYDPYNLKGVLRLAMPAMSMAGNCGPSNTWYCKFIGQGSDDGYTSRIAVHNFRDSFRSGISTKISFLEILLNCGKNIAMTWLT